MTQPGWQVRDYPAMPAEVLKMETYDDAILSRAESGAVYWDAPNPRRSFVRGAVYDQRGALINQSQRKGGMNSDMVLSVNPPVITSREIREATSARESGQWLYGGSWMHGFGHFLVETLPTLWPLLDSASEFIGICAHRFNSRKTYEWQYEIVGLLDVGEVRVIDDTPVSFEKLAVATRPYHYQVAIHPRAAMVWDKVSMATDPLNDDSGASPIYLSRTRFQRDMQSRGVATGREFSNGNDVDRVFADRGFTVIYPETLSVLEQIRLARAAPIIAGVAGSALHLSVFAKPGARVIEVGDARTGGSLVATQRAISAVKEQPTAQIPYQGDSSGAVDLAHLKSTLDALSLRE
ncbi:DUF563 domain-containing protein [Microbacterium sp. NPDC056234]|uniref:glycosyltransferase family 61 protein n=1 Tax=Microbacterium sp. NPDC056234 TaxID=3345757 RepID=UPI0035D765BC